GRGDEAIDGLADQRLEARVLIGAAVGGEDARVLALRRHRIGELGRLAQRPRLGEAKARSLGAAEQRKRKRRRPPRRAPSGRPPVRCPPVFVPPLKTDSPPSPFGIML